MIEAFKTLSSYIDKIVQLFDTVFSHIRDSVSELNVWISYFPPVLVTAAGIIILVIVIYKILGRS